MDELTFAQFDIIKKLPNKQKCELMKRVDVNYCFQDKSNLTQDTKYFDSNTCLHRAIHNQLCSDCVEQLLNRGAGLFIQKTLDGKTPLLEAIDVSYKNKFSIWRMMGKLEHEVAEILLSAQIKTGNPLNPKDKEGVSHFHVACIIDHVEAVNFFLEVGESVNQVINCDTHPLSGYTALHCAIRYSSVETVEILMNHGADIFLRDARGRSSLHLLIERLIDLNDYMNMGKRSCCSFFKLEILKLQTIVCHISEKKQADVINFTDDTGLTELHMACALRNKDIVETLLQENVNINAFIKNNANFLPGYSPLHFAACFNTEIVKLLLQNDGIITKNVDGKTPLDLCMERYSPEVIHSILSSKPEFQNIVLSDGFTSLLDVLMIMNDCDKFNNFLKNSKNIELSVPHDSPLWPGNTLLHLSILMNEKTSNLKDFYDTIISGEIKEAPQTSYNCSEKDELAYWKRIVICLVRGCSLTTKNAEGLTPIHLAFKLRKANVVDKFLNSCKSDVADPNNLTHFHIACVIGKKSFVDKFLNEGVDVNGQVKISFEWWGKPRRTRKTPYLITVRANSTALHLAVIFEHLEVIELLLRNGADVYAQDACGLTPIHLSVALASESNSVAQLLLSKTSDLKEVVTDQGLPYLHVAAYANNSEVVDKLVERGSNVDVEFTIPEPKNLFGREHEYGEFSFLVCLVGQTPLYVAMMRKSVDAVRSLIRAGADIFKRPISNFPKMSPLKNALADLQSEQSSCLVRRVKREFKYEIGPIEDSGITSLHLACATFDLVWAKDLLKKGANVNARVRFDGDYKGDLWSGETPLHVIVRQLSEVETLPKNLIIFVKMLLKHGADVAIQDSNLDTPLHANCENIRKRDVALLSSLQDLLLKSQQSYDVNPMDYHARSHFHIACTRNSIDVVEKFLDNGVDVNHHASYFVPSRYDAGFTSLHYAFHFRHADLASLLIERGANVKAETTFGNTPLHVAVMRNCMDLEVLDLLYRKGADFNTENLEGMTPLMCLFTLQNFTLEQLNFFLERNGKFDITHYQSSEGLIGLASKNAKPCDRTQIIGKILKAGDCWGAINAGFNAIRSVVSVNQNEILTATFYAILIESFEKRGCDLDELDEEGRTPLHDAIRFYNVEAVHVLLSFGADLFTNLPVKLPGIADAIVEPERKDLMTKVLKNHTYKFKTMQNHLKNPADERAIISVDSADRLRWRDELKKMDRSRINNSLTVKSFMRDGISSYAQMASTEREVVDSYFKNVQEVNEEFPIFCGFLNMQYRKAVSNVKCKVSEESAEKS